jgi:hypothetical protein
MNQTVPRTFRVFATDRVQLYPQRVGSSMQVPVVFGIRFCRFLQFADLKGQPWSSVLRLSFLCFESVACAQLLLLWKPCKIVMQWELQGLKRDCSVLTSQVQTKRRYQRHFKTKQALKDWSPLFQRNHHYKDQHVCCQHEDRGVLKYIAEVAIAQLL